MNHRFIVRMLPALLAGLLVWLVMWYLIVHVFHYQLPGMRTVESGPGAGGEQSGAGEDIKP